ncbi:MAG: hypothetical protein QW231_05465 [Candidatus Bathyarchaeia archaeon]
MVDMSILGKLKAVIDSYWAKYMAFRVAFVITFLAFITVIPIFTIKALSEFNPIYPYVFSLIFVAALVVIPLVVTRVLHKPYFFYVDPLSEYEALKVQLNPLYAKFRVISWSIVMLWAAGDMIWCYTRGDLIGTTTFGVLFLLMTGSFMVSVYKLLKSRLLKKSNKNND